MAALDTKRVVSEMISDAGIETKGFEEDAVSISEAAARSSGHGEISPELLKNTPSNIARLEGAIEQCKGRQKYLAQTGSPSDGSDVRWYFCKVSLAENELAASLPRKEIVGKGEFFRFGMRDSLAIEASFLQREEECLSSWWKEYAECSEGPREDPSSSNKVDPEGAQPAFYAAEDERVGVPVKGGLYEVDLVKRHSFPIYWNGDNRRVLRGHWFARKGGLDWLPLREDVAEQLEFAYRSQVWHRRTFQPSGLFAARVDLQGPTPGLHALFTGEDDTWEAWLIGDASGLSSVISLSGNGTKLRRGYSPSQSHKPTQDELRQQKEEEMDDYCSQVPVRHVVFMVHGIGQRLEKSNFVDDVGTFRQITDGLAERHLTPYQRGTQRVLYIPCQWRRGLKLSGESAVEKITLDGVRGLRVMLSATVHDVLYYMSPIYCQDIVNSVSNQLNRLYLQFLKRNPGYDGKVSIYGHSLGSVLSYDILCHQENLSSPFPLDWIYKEQSKTEEPRTDIQSLVSQPLPNLENKNVNFEEKTLIVQEEHSDDSSTIVNHVTPKLNGPSEEKDDPDETKNICCECEDSALESMTDQVPHCSEDVIKENKLLKEEINSVKARIAELESMLGNKDTSCGLHRGNTEVYTTMPGTPISDKLTEGEDDAPKSYTPYIKYTKLEFKVDTFFAVGSPLGVFLALRNVRIGMGKGKDYWAEKNIIEEIPACRRVFNIFHPFDPVAYRIEPLICKELISKRPVMIPYHKGGKRLHIGFQDFAEDLAARSQAFMDRLYSVRTKVLTVCQSRDKDNLEEAEEISNDKEARSYGLAMMGRLTGNEEGRVDHMLQDKTFEHAYISAIGSHTNYWRDYDTALFMIKHLYQDIPDDPNSSQDSDGRDISKNMTGTKRWSDKRASVEERLPLTFSDSALVTTFSRNAKKTLK